MRNEDFRRKANLIIVWVSWPGALILTFAVVTDMLTRDVGVVVVMLIGIGVTSSLIRSRYRLADTISEVLVTGIRLAKEQDLGDQAEIIEPKDR